MKRINPLSLDGHFMSGVRVVKRSTPGLLAMVSGLLLVAIPVTASHLHKNEEGLETAAVNPAGLSTPQFDGTTGAALEATDTSTGSISLDDSGNAQIGDSQDGNRVTISIESHSQSTSGDPGSGPTVTINGQTKELPANGRISETYRDDDSRTRIRARIDNDANSSTSIRISTNQEIETGSD